MDGKPQLSRRERQTAARSDQILDAAARLFAERGFHRTTTRDIAQAADVAEGTLYNYFANKDDLLLGIMHRLTDTFDHDDSQSRSEPTQVRDHFISLLMLRSIFEPENSAMMQALLSEILANSELRESYYHQVLEPTILDLEKSLTIQAHAGQIKVEDISATARVIAGMVIGLFFLKVIGDPHVKPEPEWLDQVVIPLLLDGISGDKQ